MRPLLLLLSFMFVVVGVALLFEQPAYAYADPGTGLLAIQALGSALIATGWYLRRKIYLILHRSPTVDSEAGHYATNNEEKEAN